MPQIFWIIQALGFVTIILTILSFFQKEKWKMMLFLTLTNATMIATYILADSLLGGLLVAGALVRTIVYFYFSRNNKKPDAIVMIMFEIYYIVISIVMWNNSVIDLFMIINLIIVTYTSWQNDVKTLRFGYIFSSLLLIPYDILLGAYATAVSEVIMLGSVIFSLIKYSKATKSSKNVAQRYFNANKQFWGSNVIENPDYDLIISDTVDKTPFYNFGIIKNYDDLYNTVLKIKDEFKLKKLNEIAYLPFDPKNYDRYASDAYMLQMFFPVEFHDVWMKLIDGFNLNNTKCKIQNVEFKEVDEKDIEDLITVYIKGYHAKTDLNNLDENEKLQVENLRKVDFQDNEVNGYKTYAYIAYYNNIPISLVCMLSNNVETFITKVSTVPAFRRKHVASALMQFGIRKQRSKGIQEIILVTDKYSSNEKFYAFNSFVEFGQAFALNVTDISKYKGFVDENIIE